MFALLFDDELVKLGDVGGWVLLQLADAHFATELDKTIVVDKVDWFVGIFTCDWLIGDEAGCCWIEGELGGNDSLIDLFE